MSKLFKYSKLEIIQQKKSVEEVKKLFKKELIVILDNIRSKENVGSIFRSSDALGIEKIYLCGITPAPPDKVIEKTALGATEVVDWEKKFKTEELIGELKLQGYAVWGLEICQGSKKMGEVKMPKKLAIVLGNEVEGLSQNVLDLLNEAVHLEMKGRANSLNVANAFVAFGYLNDFLDKKNNV